MKLNITIQQKKLTKLRTLLAKLRVDRVAILIAVLLSIVSSAYNYFHDYILIYGDAESHINIAKRVITDITPGAAQLGGIWLPLPHLMMIPFVYIDVLWRTGLAGAIVSGFCYIITAIYVFKLLLLLTENKWASFIGFLIFALNPNILYIQSTPMTELTLIMFFILSTYYFVQFIQNEKKVFSMIAAGFFGFCATLSRYDGWFLVAFEVLIIMLVFVIKRKNLKELEGKMSLFLPLASFGIFLWMLWDYLILGDPFYFTNSQFSAKSQQANWLVRGELPAYHDALQSFLYYAVTTMANSGIILFVLFCIGVFVYLRDKKQVNRFYISLILFVPFIFNVFTMFVGQSVIFIQDLTPVGFEWRLFNVRYGVMMIPVIAFFVGYLFLKSSINMKKLIIVLMILQAALFSYGYSRVITRDDGVRGLSSAKRPDAERWIHKNYDKGLVLMDDYARTISVVRSGIPMQNTIYIGNKPYWQESLVAPEKYARWIVMQKDDTVWKNVYAKPATQERLYKYFQKVYTSPDILIFRRNDRVQ